MEFLEPSEARKAFTKLAYTKFKNAPLYLEWAPDNSLKPSTKIAQNKSTNNETNEKANTKLNDNISSKMDEDKKENNKDKEEEVKEVEEEDEDEDEPEPDTTLFVKNLNFITTEEDLRKVCSP